MLFFFHGQQRIFSQADSKRFFAWRIYPAVSNMPLSLKKRCGTPDKTSARSALPGLISETLLGVFGTCWFNIACALSRSCLKIDIQLLWWWTFVGESFSEERHDSDLPLCCGRFPGMCTFTGSFQHMFPTAFRCSSQQSAFKRLELHSKVKFFYSTWYLSVCRWLGNLFMEYSMLSIPTWFDGQVPALVSIFESKTRQVFCNLTWSR